MPISSEQLREIEERLRRDEYENKARRLDLTRTFLFTYIALVIAVLGIFSIRGDLFKRGSDENDRSQVQSQVEQLDSKVKSLQKTIDDLGHNEGNAAINAKVDSMDEKLDALSATILADPDKALTARLLREKQINLEADVKGVKADTDATRHDFVNLVITVLAIPLIGALITFLVDRYKGQKKAESRA